MTTQFPRSARYRLNNYYTPSGVHMIREEWFASNGACLGRRLKLPGQPTLSLLIDGRSGTLELDCPSFLRAREVKIQRGSVDLRDCREDLPETQRAALATLEYGHADCGYWVLGLDIYDGPCHVDACDLGAYLTVGAAHYWAQRNRNEKARTAANRLALVASDGYAVRSEPQRLVWTVWRVDALDGYPLFDAGARFEWVSE